MVDGVDRQRTLRALQRLQAPRRRVIRRGGTCLALLAFASDALIIRSLASDIKSEIKKHQEHKISHRCFAAVQNS